MTVLNAFAEGPSVRWLQSEVGGDPDSLLVLRRPEPRDISGNSRALCSGLYCAMTLTLTSSRFDAIQFSAGLVQHSTCPGRTRCLMIISAWDLALRWFLVTTLMYSGTPESLIAQESLPYLKSVR